MKNLSSPCIPHVGRVGTHGYGVVGRRLAHRAAWEEANGPIESGMTIDHLCRVRTCVNVDHMRLLTNVENARMNGNWVRTSCKRGHAFTPENTEVNARGHRRCKQCLGLWNDSRQRRTAKRRSTRRPDAVDRTTAQQLLATRKDS